jgi:tetratricopeptide (TPR) repeat protein
VKSGKAAPYALALVLFALGLMAKPMLVTLPFTLLLLDLWPLGRLSLPLRGRGREMRMLVREKVPFVVLSAASCIITVFAQRAGGAVRSLTLMPLTERAANAVHSYAAYLGKTVWPADLAVFYPYPRTALFSWSTGAALLLLAGLTFAVLRLRARAPYLLIGWLWYLGTLVPVIGVVQVGDQAMADRYTYVPLLGLFIAAAWGLAALVQGNQRFSRAAAAAALAALAALAAATHAQTGTWKNAETLFRHALEVTSDNWMAHNGLGYTLARSGGQVTEEALAHFYAALQIDSSHPDIHNNLAMALKAAGRPEEALGHFQAALALKPSEFIPLKNLVVTLLQLDRAPEALSQVREVRRSPSNGIQEIKELGRPLLQAGMDRTGRRDYAVAVPLLEEASALLGTLPPECLLQWGIALLELNRFEEAAEKFSNLIAVDPQSGEAQFHLAYALSQLQRPAEALPHYRLAYGKPGVRSEAFVWIGDIYRKGDLCVEAVQVYSIIPPTDPAYPAAAAGTAACGGTR